MICILLTKPFQLYNDLQKCGLKPAVTIMLNYIYSVTVADIVNNVYTENNSNENIESVNINCMTGGDNLHA